eukprot:tig00000430_g633.t1
MASPRRPQRQPTPCTHGPPSSAFAVALRGSARFAGVPLSEFTHSGYRDRFFGSRAARAPPAAVPVPVSSGLLPLDALQLQHAASALLAIQSDVSAFLQRGLQSAALLAVQNDAEFLDGPSSSDLALFQLYSALSDSAPYVSAAFWAGALWFGWNEERRGAEPVVEFFYRRVAPLLGVPAEALAPPAEAEGEDDGVVSPTDPWGRAARRKAEEAEAAGRAGERAAELARRVATLLSVFPFFLVGYMLDSTIQSVLGDGWPLSSGILAFVSAQVYEIARPKALTPDEAEKEIRLAEDFASFARERLEARPDASVHITDISRAFRLQFGRYRTESQLPEAAIRRLMRRTYPASPRTRGGFYKGVALKPSARDAAFR